MFAPMPMYAQPQMQYAQPQMQYAQPQGQNYPKQRQPQRQQMPSPAYLAAGNVPPPQWAPPPSAARMASAETPPAPKLQPLALPAPEALGIRPGTPAPLQAATAKVDWNEVHARLNRMGALRFQLDKLPDGRTRAGFWLPTGPMSAPYPVEAVADTEAGAVLQALQRAETQVASRP